MNAEFDRHAGDYENLLKDPIREFFAPGSHFFHFRKWLVLRDFLAWHGMDSRELSWLDVGCGKGELLRSGREHFREAVGYDPSEGMLRHCSDLTVEHQPRSTMLPFHDARFHLVTAACVFHHVPSSERTQLTREARRVLKPGGILAILEHNPWNPVTRLIVSRAPVDANVRLLTAAETRRLTKSSGLTVLETSYYLYFPQALYSMLAALEKRLAAFPAGGQYAVFGRRDS